MARNKHWLSVLWGAGIGVAVASYLWGTSPRAGLIIGDKIIFTLVIPMVALLACLAVSLFLAGRDGGNSLRP
jgi:hypothetical protein